MKTPTESLLIESADEVDLQGIAAEELYTLLRNVSDLRSRLWDEIASRPRARALLNTQERLRMESTHGIKLGVSTESY